MVLGNEDGAVELEDHVYVKLLETSSKSTSQFSGQSGAWHACQCKWCCGRPVGSWTDCQIHWWKNVITAVSQHGLQVDKDVTSSGQMSADTAGGHEDVVDAGSAEDHATSFVADEDKDDDKDVDDDEYDFVCQRTVERSQLTKVHRQVGRLPRG